MSLTIPDSDSKAENPGGTNNRTLLLQIENRSTELLKTFMDSNQRVSKALGIEYVFMDRGPSGVPPYWWKVLVLRDLMLERPDVSLFLWLDSDAFLIPRSRTHPANLAARFPEDDLFVGPDAPILHGMTFNAGAFLVRNSPRGRSLMQRWADLYDPKLWIETKPGIFMTPGPWAGSAYEQGAFAEHLLGEPGVRRLPYFVFNEVLCDELHGEAISVHLAGTYKADPGFLEPCLDLIRGGIDEFQDDQGAFKSSVVVASIIVLAIVALAILIGSTRVFLARRAEVYS
jgi:hypothetical protein